MAAAPCAFGAGGGVRFVPDSDSDCDSDSDSEEPSRNPATTKTVPAFGRH